MLIRVHKEGLNVGWRAWTLSIADRTLSSFFNAGSSVLLTAGTIGSEVTGLQSREALVLANGGLELNRVLGSFDSNRVWNNATTSADNATGGLGTFYDSTQAECSRPCADALATTSSDTWGGGLIGTDTDPRNQFGSQSAYDYDYAIYVR